ncbi:hypothetical protein T459_16808 [Capsicum annuum]|uniref:carotenoid 9,10-dioxygenase n=1 Tax=Capsicum annuum TaxID=4072 RepID=A0A2G2Z9S6_CAPAN|nr:hypothetical protein T459_16808 [Capsicum annuum]
MLLGKLNSQNSVFSPSTILATVTYACMYSHVYISQSVSIVYAYEPTAFSLPHLHSSTFKVLTHLCYGVLYHRFRSTRSREPVASQFNVQSLHAKFTDISHGLDCGPSGSCTLCSISGTRFGALQTLYQSLSEYRLKVKLSVMNQSMDALCITPDLSKYTCYASEYRLKVKLSVMNQSIDALCITPDLSKVIGIIKFDLHAEPETRKSQFEVGENIQEIFDLRPDRFGSEAVFILSHPGTECEEDDGYLIFFVHDENTGQLVFHSLIYIFMSITKTILH